MNGEGLTQDYPWRIALRENQTITDAAVSLGIASGDSRSFKVNASCIAEGRDVTGAITTLDDVSAIEQKNEELRHLVKQLETKEQDITRQNDELKYLASHDPLSGCLNRRAFFSQFEKCLIRANRERKTLTCLMLDLAHFKQINDSHGHAVGDSVIAGTAAILSAACRNEDLVGRYGGEEFCIVLYGLSFAESTRVAERIREDVAAKSRSWLPSSERVTLCVGLAMLPDEPCTAMELVNRADQALYLAKETGRDRVVCCDITKQELITTMENQSHFRRKTDTTQGAVTLTR